MKAALLTFEQARARLNVSRTTLYHLLQSRQLPNVKLGRRWHIDPDDLETFIASRKQQTADASPHSRKTFDADDELHVTRDWLQ